jgi:7-cyano-7-deazaguanine synthase
MLNLKLPLKKLNIRKIESKLKVKKFEDLRVLKTIESILIKKRGYVFKMPEFKAKCIILATGGLDSVITTFILLKYFHLSLFPLFIDWGQKNLIQEKKAFRFFVRFFQTKFLHLYHPPKYITSHIPAKELFNTQNDVVTLRNTTFTNHAVAYAKYLEETKKVNIRTIFLNTVATDSILCPDTSLTAIRSTNLNICLNEGDFSWQITSLAIEKELGLYLNKEDLIPLVIKSHVPLEKTWSCYQSGKTQCGECFTCWGRKNGFKLAKVKDKTPYYNLSLTYKIKNKICHIPSKIKRLIHAK